MPLFEPTAEPGKSMSLSKSRKAMIRASTGYPMAPKQAETAGCVCRFFRATVSCSQPFVADSGGRVAQRSCFNRDRGLLRALLENRMNKHQPGHPIAIT